MPFKCFAPLNEVRSKHGAVLANAGLRVKTGDGGATAARAAVAAAAAAVVAAAVLAALQQTRFAANMPNLDACGCAFWSRTCALCAESD